MLLPHGFQATWNTLLVREKVDIEAEHRGNRCGMTMRKSLEHLSGIRVWSAGLEMYSTKHSSKGPSSANGGHCLGPHTSNPAVFE